MCWFDWLIGIGCYMLVSLTAYAIASPDIYTPASEELGPRALVLVGMFWPIVLV